MKIKTQLKNIASYSKGEQINGDELIENGIYDYLNGGIAPSGKWNSYNTPANTVTISEGGNSCGYVNFMSKPFWCGAHCYYLFDTFSNTKYLYYALKSQQDRLMKIRSGACMPNIKKSDLGNFEIFYETDEDVQNKVVEVLSKCENIILARKQQLQQFDELVKARFVELFGNVRDNEKNWEKASLKSVAEVRGRVGWKGYKKDDLRESGPLVLGATHLTESGCIDLSSPVYLSREKYEESPEIMLQKNDIIFTQRGNTIGKVGLLENDIGEATINPCVLILRPLTINPIYFKTYFILDETKSDMWSLNAGSAQPMITQKGIGEYMLMLPPMELQNQFAAFVKQTDKSKVVVQKALDEAQTLFDSLMQQYFG